MSSRVFLVVKAAYSENNEKKVLRTSNDNSNYNQKVTFKLLLRNFQLNKNNIIFFHLIENWITPQLIQTKILAI